MSSYLREWTLVDEGPRHGIVVYGSRVEDNVTVVEKAEYEKLQKRLNAVTVALAHPGTTYGQIADIVQGRGADL